MSDKDKKTEQEKQKVDDVKDPAGPNDNWKDDPNLDDKGNPIDNPTIEPNSKLDDKPNPSDKSDDKGGDQVSTDDEVQKVDLSAPVVKQVADIIEQAGLDSATVAREVTANNGEITPAIMKALVEKHGEAVASIVATQLNQFHKSNQAATKKRDQAIFDTVASEFKDVTDQSGADSWKELAGWAKTNIPTAERSEINKLLAQGGLAAQYAVKDLVNRFKSSENFTQDAQLLDGDTTVKDYGVQPLSKSEYQREFRALEAKGHVYGQSRELAALDKRRSLGMQRGI